MAKATPRLTRTEVGNEVQFMNNFQLSEQAPGGWGGVFDAPVGGCRGFADSAPATLGGPIFFAALVAVCLAATVRADPPANGPDAAPSGADAASSSAFHRRVHLPALSPHPAVVFCEFFAHGQLSPHGENLAVSDGSRNPVPWHVLQAGPGDYCRVAFQTVPREDSYTITYGGKKAPWEPPEWTATTGLLLETRHWKRCDLRQARSVRAAFDAAEPIGRLYVPNVFHRYNPLAPGPEPFLSLYTGTLHIGRPGDYPFFTSSQDCSFLMIDGREVVSAPGAHGPVGRARYKGTITLKAGLHRFEYLHAASGPDACMVAAWQPPGVAKPEILPPEVFGSTEVAHLAAVGPWSEGNRPMHDMQAEAVGEVVLASFDDAPPLVRVAFRSPNLHGRPHWDFGDGQTSKQPAPQHIYLHPGMYTVQLSVPGEAAALAVTNRIEVGRPAVFADENHPPPDSLAGYLAVLREGDPAKLNPLGLVQLVRAEIEAGQPEEAAAIGRAGVLADQAAADPAALDLLVQLVGPLLRDVLDDPEAALAAWSATAATKAEIPPARRAAYEIEAADIALGDLLRTEDAIPWLDAASRRITDDSDPALTARLYRVRGDLAARRGDRAAAVAAYQRAIAGAPGSRRKAVEQSSARGAYSASTEAYLREKLYDRALAELRRWQEEYPLDKLEGSLPLLQARYAAARGKHAKAIALAGDALAVNPDSPDADRLACLAADCEAALGHADRAAAGYRAFLNDYPGSPLVNEVQQKLAKLTGKGSAKN
jgi:tetratricopeptide (TPR) repeat protein